MERKVLCLLLALHTVLSAKNGTNMQKKDSPSNKSIISPKVMLQKNYSDNFFKAELAKLQTGIHLYERKIQHRQNERKKSEKKILRRILHKCKKINCPLVEKSVCAKFFYKNKNIKPFYVSMINECEINYMKCHRGLESTIVSMENCHSVIDNTQLLSEQPGNRRTKRSVREAKPDTQDDGGPAIEGSIEIADDNSLITRSGKQNVTKQTGYENDSKQIYHPKSTNRIDRKTTPKRKKIDKPPPVKQPLVDDDDTFYAEEEYRYEPNDLAPIINLDVDEDIQAIEDESEDEAPFEEISAKTTTKTVKDDILDYKDSDSDSDSVPKEYEDDVEVDMIEYNAECPRQCPARDTMVCALCQHGVYRTFLSVCHMRMYQCKFIHERLELVSRYPCVMSAPLITEDPPMQPQGRVSEPGDHDRVLRFVRCREKGLLGKSAKCTFKDAEKLSREDDDGAQNLNYYY